MTGANAGAHDDVADQQEVPASRHAPVGRRLLTYGDLMLLLHLYPVRGLARLLPASEVHKMGVPLELLRRALACGFGRRLRARIAHLLAVDADRAREIAREYLRNAVARDLDDLAMDRMGSDDAGRCLEVVGLEHLRQVLRGGRGAVLVTGHFFANRLGKRYLARQGYPVLSVRRGQPPPHVSGVLGMRFLHPTHSKLLTQVIRHEVLLEDPEATLKILKWLRGGGIVDVHLDAPFSSRTHALPLLGMKWPFPVGFLRVARMAGAPLLPALFLGNSRGFRIIIDEPLAAPSASGQEELIASCLPALARRLEAQILAHPAQWEVWVRL